MHQAGGEKHKAILLELKTVLLIKNGVPFKQVKKLVRKLYHGAIEILASKAIFGPINQLMAMKPTKLFLCRCLAVRETLHNLSQLIQEASKEPMHVNELVPRDPEYKGVCVCVLTSGAGQRALMTRS